MEAAGRWIATAASIWIQCSCGATYAFGVYSPILKSTQGYDQSTLDAISVFKDIGANAGVLSGILYSSVCRDRDPHELASWLRGPWVVLATGAVHCFVGYFFLWLTVTGAIVPPPVSVVCFFMFIAAHSQTYFNTANVVTAVRNFPDYSGTIVGIMKGFLGLSGALFIQVYQTLFADTPSTFLLMLALVPTFLSLVLMFFVKVHDAQSNSHDKKYLNLFSLISTSVASYVMFLIILESVFVWPQWAHALSLALLLTLLSSPISIVIKSRKDDLLHLTQTFPTVDAPLLKTPELTRPESSSLPQSSIRTTSEVIPDTVEEVNLVQAMLSLNFWLLSVAMLCGMGSGLATINNISQIGESLGYTPTERSTLVSLWSIWNFFGRFGAGYISDICMRKKGWARPFFMTLTLAAMTGGHVVIGSGFPGNLYVGSVLVGVCYGSQWSLMPTIASEIFGVLHMGTIFNTIAIASPLGSYILSVHVIGYIYDRETLGTDNSCQGTHCFMLSFFILSSVSFLGFLVALVLWFKTREVYARIMYRRMYIGDACK